MSKAPALFLKIDGSLSFSVATLGRIKNLERKQKIFLTKKWETVVHRSL